MKAMKKLEDYIHLYIGAKCTIHQLGEKPGSTGVIIGVHLDDAFTSNPWVIVRDADRSERSIRLYEIKLILRPLDDMSEGEETDMKATMDVIHFKGLLLQLDSGETFSWMLKHGFDLFGLIPAGLAQKREG